jgi:hypothetical protein
LTQKECGPAGDGAAEGATLAYTEHQFSAASPDRQDSFDRIPHELRSWRQWVVWRFEHVNGKLTKVPYTPNTIRHARTNDANTWCAFDVCVAAVRAKQWDGIGFVFTRDDPYCFIDLDAPKDANGQHVHNADVWERQNSLYKAANSYSETSPSGHGLHIIVRAALPEGKGRKRDHIEIYSEGRFATFTGNVVNAASITPQQQLCEQVWHYLASDSATDTADVDMSTQPTEGNDVILQRARNAANGDKFNRLWNGDLSMHDNDESAADMALCEMLAFYTSSAEQIERLWLMSPLGNRDKTQKRKDYRNRTIRAALARVESRRPPPVDSSALQRQFEAMVSSPIPTPQSAQAGSLGPSFSPPSASPNVVGWDDFLKDSKPPFYIVQRMLQAGSLYAFTASWGAGKTAVGVTIAMHVAAGLPLGPIKVARSKVLYLCGENPDDVKLRARATAMRFNIDWNELRGWMHFTKRPFAIDNPTALAAFVADAAPHGPFGLVIVDTGPAHSEAEDENDNRQMHKLAMALRDLMAPLADTQTNRAPATMVLMHPAKTAKRDEITARGGGAFLGSVDGELLGWRAEPEDPVEVFHRQKFRGPGFKPMFFNLERHTFDAAAVKDNFGDGVTAVIAVLSDEQPEKRPSKITGAALIALNALKHCGDDASIAIPPTAAIRKEYEHAFVPAPTKVVPEYYWRQRCYVANISHGKDGSKTTAFNRAWKTLTEAGVVETWDDHYWLREWRELRKSQPPSDGLL